MTFDELPKAVKDLQEAVSEIKRLILASQAKVQPTPDNADRLFTIAQAAEFLNLTKGSLYQLVHKGKIPFSKRGRLFFSEKDLRTWIQSGRHQTVREIEQEAINALDQCNRD